MSISGITRNASLFGHRDMGGPLQADRQVVNTVPAVVILATGCAKLATPRFLSTASGTLSFAFARPNGVAYTAGNPANIAVTGGTPITPVALATLGAGTLIVTFTPTADGSITYADIAFTD